MSAPTDRVVKRTAWYLCVFFAITSVCIVFCACAPTCEPPPGSNDLTPEQLMSLAKPFKYKYALRNAWELRGEYAVFKGRVVETRTSIRLATDGDNGDVVVVYTTSKCNKTSGKRVLVGDIITVYGYIDGNWIYRKPIKPPKWESKYETLPRMIALHIEIDGVEDVYLDDVQNQNLVHK